MTEESEGQRVYKVVLGEKVVLLREMKIKHQNLALKAVGSKAGDNQALLGSQMQQELLKMLLVSINDQEISKSDLEDLDSLFSYKEYMQILTVIQKIMGVDEDDLGELEIESVFTGKK